MKLRWFSYLLLSPSVFATLVNVSIDNKYGDPRTGAQFIYSPNGAWFDEPGCLGCKVHPDPSMAYKGTWVDSTFNSHPGSNPFPNTVLTASINFTGTAVYVFCIMANAIRKPDLMFFLDGAQVGSYIGVPDGTPTFDYSVLVYANVSLQEGIHTLTLQNGVVNGPKSLVLFDYLTYTFDDSSTATSSSPFATPSSMSPNSFVSSVSRRKIVAIILGTIGGLFLVAIVILFRRHLSNRKVSLNLNVSLKFPGTFFRGRGVSAVGNANRPSFNPSLLVERTSPTPLPFSGSLLPRYVVPAESNRMSLPVHWNEGPLVPQRRQETESSHWEGVSMDVREQRTNLSRGLDNHALLPQNNISEVDLSSHYDSFLENRTPPEPTVLPRARRFTVRNK